MFFLGKRLSNLNSILKHWIGCNPKSFETWKLLVKIFSIIKSFFVIFTYLDFVIVVAYIIFAIHRLLTINNDCRFVAFTNNSDTNHRKLTISSSSMYDLGNLYSFFVLLCFVICLFNSSHSKSLIFLIENIYAVCL